MKKDELQLNEVDYASLEIGDRVYLANKGIKLYDEEKYSKAIEYFRMASTLGDPLACYKLGECYLYGNGVTENASIAIAYFKIASRARSIDAFYKLGEIYSSNKWVKENKELSAFYYMHSLKELTKGEQSLYFSEKVRRYPSLCLTLAKEELPGGSFILNLNESYELLRTAKIGYKILLLNGKNEYEKEYQETCKYLKDDMFDTIEKNFRKKYGVDESDDFINRG